MLTTAGSYFRDHDGTRLLLATLCIAWCFPGTSVGQASRPATVTPESSSPNHPLQFFALDGSNGQDVGTPDLKGKGASPSHTLARTLTIRKPSAKNRSETDSAATNPTRSSTQAMTTVASALFIVLASFFLLVWLTRSVHKRRWNALPSSAVQVLGRAPLVGRQWMQLVRIGNKLVMLSVNGSQVDTITEITNPEEVEQLVALCHQDHPDSIRQTFQDVLDHYSQQQATSSWPTIQREHHSSSINAG